MLKQLALKRLPAQRVQQLSNVKKHLRGTWDSMRHAPSGVDVGECFARRASDSVKGFLRLYTCAKTRGDRDQVLRSFLEWIRLENNAWRLLEETFVAKELGPSAHAFALGVARYCAGNFPGAIEAFERGCDSEHGALAYLCLARAHVALTKDAEARAVVEKGLREYPSDMALFQQQTTLAYRSGEFEVANQLLASRQSAVAQLLSESINVDGLGEEIDAALAAKTVVRPKAAHKDVYNESLVEWYWRDMWWAMNAYTPFQDGLGWLRGLYEKIIDDVLKMTAPDTESIINFGVLCAEPDFRLAKKHAERRFYGVDREAAAKRLNDEAYPLPNLRFIQGQIDSHLPVLSVRDKTMLFHARTGTLCYPQYLRNLYRQCAELGVNTVVMFENNALDRRALRYWDFDHMERDAVPYMQHMFIHNYPRYLKEAGYEIIKVERVPYPEVFHSNPAVGFDGHVTIVARLR